MPGDQVEAAAIEDARRMLDRPWLGPGSPVDRAWEVIEKSVYVDERPPAWALDLVIAERRGGGRPRQPRDFVICRAVRVVMGYGFTGRQACRLVTKALPMHLAEENVRKIWGGRADEEPPATLSRIDQALWLAWRCLDGCPEARRALARDLEAIRAQAPADQFLEAVLQLLAAIMVDNLGERGALDEAGRARDRLQVLVAGLLERGEGSREISPARRALV